MASRLADATSPYLRAHADNPVAWYPWGTEAFAEAARRDVPVMISIGYSTCHWCHVMARESFADPETAAELNDGFVAIKVDREEHPEVDEAYLAAASAFTPNLGWPLTVFTTPTGRAFYAGTYFPPTSRAGLPSFRTVLAAVREAWTERRGEIEQTAQALRDALAGGSGHPPGETLPSVDDLTAAARRLAAREDEQYGGFADAAADMQTPKFPIVPALRFLQTRLVRQQAPDAAAVADRAFAAMAESPLRDGVDGGFFRYATRRDWTVPHYERMLTDNAGLMEVAMSAGRLDLAASTATFLRDSLQQSTGGFGAAQDSESWIDGARQEGGYYLRDATSRAALDPPAVDGKVITGWNGMAIGALARAGAMLDDERLVESAQWATDAVLEVNTTTDGALRRASLHEVPSRASAALEDYGLLATGLIALAVATGTAAYAQTARRLVDASLTGGAPAVPGGGDPILAEHGTSAPQSASDGGLPSGIASVALAAARLWLIGAGDRYYEAAAEIVRAHASQALAEPLAHGALLEVAALLAIPPRQIVVITDDPSTPIADAARRVVADVTAILPESGAGDLARAGFALFEAKVAQDAKPTAYDCADFVCRLPLTDPRHIRE